MPRLSIADCQRVSAPGREAGGPYPLKLIAGAAPGCPAHVHHYFEQLVLRVVVNVGKGLAPEWLTGRPGQHLTLGWLFQLDDREQRAWRKIRRRCNHLKGRGDLVSGERVKRIGRRRAR